MAVVPIDTVTGDPAFITYLLTPDLCDCFFIVGNRDLVEPERIGVVKKMLLAHSVVLRSDMLAREMEEKKDVPVNDTYPDTFKNLLRYVYGYDNTGSLDFDDADNLLYVAEKYQVESLKARLSARLIKLLNPYNICSLVNNPACYKVLELDSAITRILQYETDKVLASPQFIDLTCDALVKIVEQQALNVPEIEVWRSALRWANHHCNQASGEDLRQVLEKPAKHIRVCTIDEVSLVNDVFITGILTLEEVKMVCLSKKSGEREEGLVSFSNEVECRKQTSLESTCHTLTFGFHQQTSGALYCTFYVLTKSNAVELLPLILLGMERPQGLTYENKCKITISRITDLSNNTSTEAPETITVSRQVEYEQEFSLPLAKDGKNIILKSNNKYKVMMEFSVCTYMYWSKNKGTWKDEHISVEAGTCNSYDYYRIPTKALHYRALPYNL